MLKRIFNNPLSVAIIAAAIFLVMWTASLFPSDYKLGLFLQFTGTAIFSVALMLCLVWAVYRVRTVYSQAKGIDPDISPDTKGKMVASTYLSVAIVMLAAAVLSVS